MNNIYTFIPAPAGYQLAVWRYAVGESIYPLVGWLMQPHATPGAPVILEGVGVRVLHADAATCTQLVTPETAPNFDLERWADFVASTPIDAATAAARIKSRETTSAAKWPEAPIVKVIYGRRGDSVEVVCPLCPRNHFHGAATGHRAAHCGGKHYRPGAGYVITDPKGLLSEAAWC